MPPCSRSPARVADDLESHGNHVAVGEPQHNPQPKSQIQIGNARGSIRVVAVVPYRSILVVAAILGPQACAQTPATRVAPSGAANQSERSPEPSSPAAPLTIDSSHALVARFLASELPLPSTSDEPFRIAREDGVVEEIPASENDCRSIPSTTLGFRFLEAYRQWFIDSRYPPKVGVACVPLDDSLASVILSRGDAVPAERRAQDTEDLDGSASFSVRVSSSGDVTEVICCLFMG